MDHTGIYMPILEWNMDLRCRLARHGGPPCSASLAWSQLSSSLRVPAPRSAGSVGLSVRREQETVGADSDSEPDSQVSAV